MTIHSYIEIIKDYIAKRCFPKTSAVVYMFLYAINWEIHVEMLRLHAVMVLNLSSL